LTNGFADFTTSELLGRDLFFNGQTRCNQCHANRMFQSNQPFINGLEVDYGAAGDAGIGDLTGQADDDGRFKTVSLRNVGLSAPYMHDGRFATLREVVDFYSDDIQHHPFLDERLSETGAGPLGQEPYQLNLTEEERDALEDFLHTLSDTVLIDAWWLSNPF
jgi:cytochrome c peroxidase